MPRFVSVILEIEHDDPRQMLEPDATGTRPPTAYQHGRPNWVPHVPPRLLERSWDQNGLRVAIPLFWHGKKSVFGFARLQEIAPKVRIRTPASTPEGALAWARAYARAGYGVVALALDDRNEEVRDA